MNSVNSLAGLKTPADVARASRSYRFRVWTAMLGLVLFVLLYVGLAGWFSYTAYRMIAGVFAGGDGAVAAFFAALPCAFLAIFMWKALFFVRPGAENPGVEITEADQPELFAFLYDLADELGAPRPHRVFLSPDVNASVFYDLSILNFFIPSKKNLTIGLGLVNVLNRSEFKAVLAHEFGHFAQRSMAVGRWVYVGEQVAWHIIAKRDALDKTLDFISHIDLRVAWIGWIMRTVVWSIRSLMETVFRWVVIAQRALSREMEFHADLVAVSATGSDALIHALYRLQPADEDWERSLSFANAQLRKERVVTDLFAVQTRIGEHMRRVLNDPTHGRLPEPTSNDPAERRLFTEQIAQPPRMWSTHPPNTEREENAKRVYIPAPIDAESAWTLFQNPDQTRESVTKCLFDRISFEKPPEPLPTPEALAALDESYSHESYNTRYRGAYLGRPVSIGVHSFLQFYGRPPEEEDLAKSLRELYPEHLHDSLTQWRNLEEEIGLLEAVEAGYLDATGGVVRHRGQVVPRRELPELISRIKEERDEILAKIEEHDRNCRTICHAAAKQIGQGWPEYLESLGRLLHYAEHSEADLNDAHGHLANITAMSTASGRVSSRKLKRIIASANDLQSVMARLDEQAETLALPEPVLKELELEKWRDAFEKLGLPPADEQNIGQWMKVVDSWVIPMSNRLGSLRKAVLGELLKAEKYAAGAYLGKEEQRSAPEPAAVPQTYPARPRGSERDRQKKLDWWSRFTLADGMVPGVLRFAVAATIVAAVVLAGLYVGSAEVIVYNGLATPVTVAIEDQEVTLFPFQHKSLSVRARRTCTITAKTPDGRQIESFEESLERAFANYVYNIAGAAPMIEWTAAYGTATAPEPKNLGYPRWRTTTADHIFTEPPAQIETSGSGGTRLVLSSDTATPPQYLLSALTDPAEKERIIRAHAQWDADDSKHISYWLSQAGDFSDFDMIVASRLKTNPKDVPTHRAVQELARREGDTKVLDHHREQAGRHPDDPDWQYIGIRAMPDGPEQDQAFLKALERWPDHPWLNVAVGYMHSTHAEWEKAVACYERILNRPGPWFDSSAMATARLRRLLSDSPNMNDLRSSRELQTYLQLESGTDLQGSPLSAYALLNQGQVEAAYQVAKGQNADPRLQILLAASPGAKPEWQDRALQYTTEEIQSPELLIYLAALAHCNGKPCEVYFQKFEEQYPKDRPSPLVPIKKLMEEGRPDSLRDEDLDGLNPVERGMVLAAAIILYPDKAPDAWRKTARAVLFAVERPAF